MSSLELTKIQDLKCERGDCETSLTFLSMIVDEGYTIENSTNANEDYLYNYSCCDYSATRGGQCIESRETLVFGCLKCGAYYLSCPFCSEFDEVEEEETVDGEIGVYLCNYIGFNGHFYINGEEKVMSRAWVNQGCIAKNEWRGEYFEGDGNKRWVKRVENNGIIRFLSGPNGGMSNYWKCMRCNTFMDYGDK